jgi:hypothetical protein
MVQRKKIRYVSTNSGTKKVHFNTGSISTHRLHVFLWEYNRTGFHSCDFASSISHWTAGPSGVGVFSGWCSYYTTGSESVANFMIAQLQNGRFGDQRILQDATAREMHKQHLLKWCGQSGDPGLFF